MRVEHSCYVGAMIVRTRSDSQTRSIDSPGGCNDYIISNKNLKYTGPVIDEF
jgi:hypothetical protein